MDRRQPSKEPGCSLIPWKTFVPQSLDGGFLAKSHVALSAKGNSLGKSSSGKDPQWLEAGSSW